MSRRAVQAVGVLLVFIAAALPSWRRAPAALPFGTARPDVILITIDALRADHLGVYGYDRPTSPRLDALAREAVVVRQDISQAPYTKASMASLFTGLFPSSHKAYTISRSFDETMKGSVAGALPQTDVLDPSLWTMASAFEGAGYQTIGLNTNPFLLKEFGFAKGFQDYEFLTNGSELATADEVVARALDRLDHRAAGQPVFVWMHLMEPHSPYTPPARVRGLFPPRTPPRIAPENVLPAWIRQEGSLDANFYESLYDAEIRSADEALGALFDGLRQRGIWDRLVLVITADHGEEFLDHGGFEHNRTLFDEMVHVPLIVKAPGLQPGVRDIETEAVDLAPTLARAAGAALPAGLSGVDIWPELRGESRGEPWAFAERPGALYMLRTREWKFISNLEAHHELYHLTDDPHELKNLAPFELERTRDMRNQLAGVLAKAYEAGRNVRGQLAPISPRVLNRLKALGYVR
jgi:arylsulfatase A-like enzyme